MHSVSHSCHRAPKVRNSLPYFSRTLALDVDQNRRHSPLPKSIQYFVSPNSIVSMPNQTFAGWVDEVHAYHTQTQSVTSLFRFLDISDKPSESQELLFHSSIALVLVVDTSPSSSQAPVGAFHEILSTQPAKQPWTPSTATTPSVPSTTAPLSSSTAHTATATTPAHTATATTPKPLSVDHSTNGLTSSTVERTTAEPRPGMNDGSVQHERKSFPISSERDDGGEEEEVEMEYDAQEILSEFSKMPPPPSTAPPTTTTTAAKTFSPSAIRPTVSNHPGRRPAVNLMPTSFILEQKPSFTGNVSVMQTLPPIPPKQMTEAPVYEKESKKGKQSRLRRLRILNRRARVKPISMMTPRTAAVNDEVKYHLCVTLLSCLRVFS